MRCRTSVRHPGDKNREPPTPPTPLICVKDNNDFLCCTRHILDPTIAYFSDCRHALYFLDPPNHHVTVLLAFHSTVFSAFQCMFLGFEMAHFRTFKLDLRILNIYIDNSARLLNERTANGLLRSTPLADHPPALPQSALRSYKPNIRPYHTINTISYNIT